jgi:hypothetical protein
VGLRRDPHRSGLAPKRSGGQSKLPNAVNPSFLLSWNNKQAPGWAAADNNYAYGPLQRVQMLMRFVERGIRGARKMQLADLVHAMEEPATQDLRAVRLIPLLLRAVGEPKSKKLRAAMQTLREWRAAGGHRRDLDRDGTYEHNDAVILMDAWWPLLVRAEFRAALGKDLYEDVQETLPVGDHTRDRPGAPSFFDGWWGYVSKDLRDVFGKRPRGAFSRPYCGGGSKARCRAALRRSLLKALRVTPEELYAFGACEDDPQPSCWDKNRSTVASGIDIPPSPFQNRPTFQQTVALGQGPPGP